MYIKLLRQWWIILAFFGKPEPEKFTLFYLPELIDPLEFRERLKAICFQENYAEIKYRGQIAGARRLLPKDKQRHLRYYSNGKVSGHEEFDYFTAEEKHKKGDNVKILTPPVKREIREALQGGER